jgi:hypothetical protein
MGFQGASELMPRRESKNNELDRKLASGEIRLDSPEYWDTIAELRSLSAPDYPPAPSGSQAMVYSRGGI